MSKEEFCIWCGTIIHKEKNYYPVHDIEQQKTLIYCSKDCFEEYINFMRKIEKDEK